MLESEHPVFEAIKHLRKVSCFRASPSASVKLRGARVAQVRWIQHRQPPAFGERKVSAFCAQTLSVPNTKPAQADVMMDA
jgi:hypothetical protein